MVLLIKSFSVEKGSYAIKIFAGDVNVYGINKVLDLFIRNFLRFESGECVNVYGRFFAKNS